MTAHPLATLSALRVWWVPPAVSVICCSTIRQEMIAHSALGVPGGLALLTNLVTTVDFDEETHVAVRGPAACIASTAATLAWSNGGPEGGGRRLRGGAQWFTT
jgi:hypothetical protein